MRKREKEEELSLLKKDQDKKVKDYFEAKIKGKKTNQDIFWSVKDDFFNFANNQGGYWVKFADRVKDYVDKIEKKK